MVLGAAPKELESQLLERYGTTVKFIFEARFLNCSESRNIGLKLATTRLSVCMDNDVFVRPGWLPPLVRCQNETSAGLVVPLVLEDEHRVHCAGCDMFVSKKGNRSFVGKALRYHGQTVFEDTNIKKRESDYGEMHLAVGRYKSRGWNSACTTNGSRKGRRLDGGLAWRKAGRSMMSRKSVVVYDLPMGVEHPDDIAFFCWRWDAANIVPGYKVMHEKWDMDMTEAGT